MLPLRSVLNRAYARLLQDRDEKQRTEVIDQLWAPETSEVEASMARLAAFADQMEEGGDGSAG